MGHVITVGHRDWTYQKIPSPVARSVTMVTRATTVKAAAETYFPDPGRHPHDSLQVRITLSECAVQHLVCLWEHQQLTFE
jgi:hypothetical protein